MSSRHADRRTRARMLLAVIAGAMSIGCSQQAEEAAPKSGRSSNAPKISVRVADVDEYRATLAKLRGKVVLVDYWATWCVPCVEEFPHTVEMHRKYGDRGLAAVSVSLDEPESEPQVREFLRRQGAIFENLLSEYGGGVKAIEAFGLSGAVPCYRVYDRSGELHREFAVDPHARRQYTTADVEAAVLELLE